MGDGTTRNEGCRGADAEYCGNNNLVYGCSDEMLGIGMSGGDVRGGCQGSKFGIHGLSVHQCPGSSLHSLCGLVSLKHTVLGTEKITFDDGSIYI